MLTTVGTQKHHYTVSILGQLKWAGVGEEWCLCIWSLTRKPKECLHCRSLHYCYVTMCAGVWSHSELWGSSQDLSATGRQARGLHLCAVGLWPCRLVGNLWFPLGFFNKKYLSFPIHHLPSLFPLPHSPFWPPLFFNSSCPQVMAKHTTSNNNWPIPQPVWPLVSMRPSPRWKPSSSCVHCPSTRRTVPSSSTSPCYLQGWGRKDMII